MQVACSNSIVADLEIPIAALSAEVQYWKVTAVGSLVASIKRLLSAVVMGPLNDVQMTA